jgi:hypothetical protein
MFYLIHSRGKTYREVVMISSDSSHVIQNQVMPLISGLVKEFQAYYDLPYANLVHSGCASGSDKIPFAFMWNKSWGSVFCT